MTERKHWARDACGDCALHPPLMKDLEDDPRLCREFGSSIEIVPGQLPIVATVREQRDLADVVA